MPLTFTELLDRLKAVDEISLLEILNITSEDIVDRFGDVIEQETERLVKDFDEEENESTDQSEN